MPLSNDNFDNNLGLERHMARTEAQLEMLTLKLRNLENQLEKNDDITDKVKLEIAVLKDQMAEVQDLLTEVKSTTTKLSSNMFLQFTAEMTSQKLVTILLILSTALSSPTLITSWLNGTIPAQESERIEKLINLLQENAETP